MPTTLLEVRYRRDIDHAAELAEESLHSCGRSAKLIVQLAHAFAVSMLVRHDALFPHCALEAGLSGVAGRLAEMTRLMCAVVVEAAGIAAALG